MEIIVYVLCPHEEALAAATLEYADHAWARPILLPQDQPFLESHMYVRWLMDHEAEWKYADWVGCIAWSASKKQPLVAHIAKICADASDNDADFVALMYRGDPLIRTAEHWHPGFTAAWKAAWESVGWTDTDVVLDDHIPSFYCNYWITTPQLMSQFCVMMAYLAQQLDALPDLRALMMQDSTYHDRGEEIAKMTEDDCMARFGKPYYPLYIFVMERMVCLWASKTAKNIVALR